MTPTAAAMPFDEFWAGASEHLLTEETRRAIRELSDVKDGRPDWTDVVMLSGLCNAPLAPVGAYFGFLPRLGEPGYIRASDPHPGHAVLDTADPAVLACFAAWRHLDRPLLTKVVAPAKRGRGGKPAPWAMPVPPVHPHQDDND